MLLWTEGKKSRGKNRHSVIRGKLRVSHIPGNIREPTLVSVPEHQGLPGGACWGRDIEEDQVLLFPPRPLQSLGLPPCRPVSALSPGRRDWRQNFGVSAPARAGLPVTLKKLLSKSLEWAQPFPPSQPQTCLC